MFGFGLSLSLLSPLAKSPPAAIRWLSCVIVGGGSRGAASRALGWESFAEAVGLVSVHISVNSGIHSGTTGRNYIEII